MAPMYTVFILVCYIIRGQWHRRTNIPGTGQEKARSVDRTIQFMHKMDME